MALEITDSTFSEIINSDKPVLVDFGQLGVSVQNVVIQLLRKLLPILKEKRL